MRSRHGRTPAPLPPHRGRVDAARTHGCGSSCEPNLCGLRPVTELRHVAPLLLRPPRALLIAARVLIIAVRALIIAVWKSVLQYFAPVLLRPPLESASKTRAPTAAVGVYDPSRLSQQELTACHVLSTIVTGFEQIWDVGDCEDDEL